MTWKTKAPPGKAVSSPAQRARVWLVRLGLGWLAITAGPVLVLRWVDPPLSAFMLQRRLEAARAGDEKFVLKQQWVPRSRISPHLVKALVAGEDAHFLQHHGFDFEAMADALEDRLEGKSRRGGSTLTQQVAKNLFLWPARSYVRKALEAWFTVLIELLWSKQRILEVHLNIAEYGNGLYGVELASRQYFGKSAAAVTPWEAAQLVVLLPAPRTRKIHAPTARQAERAAWVREQAERLPLEYYEGL